MIAEIDEVKYDLYCVKVGKKLSVPFAWKQRFRKAGRVWCGGARETREPHVTIGRTVSKKEATKNHPAFKDLSVSLRYTYREIDSSSVSVLVYVIISRKIT